VCGHWLATAAALNEAAALAAASALATVIAAPLAAAVLNCRLP